MSALPPKADIGGVSSDVRFVPKADIPRCGTNDCYSITALVIIANGPMVEPTGTLVEVRVPAAWPAHRVPTLWPAHQQGMRSGFH